ncbi:CdaR family protein [Siminovitchia fortis]|uniref:YbbR-like domain-containing protein n=1 Tax=Siminovitchia fortis TaxID=254758 RepID=A0A443J0W8_9BACI|nr:CdaR family protein [Siminovitchia fortis]RWR13993.1 YbbR-like domain-containing protein [Siminovitchia fortis]WHY81159.1 CdaR family protein [Siminovitchia fortis]
MDKFMDNPWFVRIVAMALAVLLFLSVQDLGNKNGASRPNGMESNEVETITDVPLEKYFDSENLVVTGLPETVNVTIEGQRRFVEATKRQRDFSIYVDLSDLSIGNHRVPILYKDFSEKLKVQVEPVYVEVSIQEKVTKDFTVEPEFNNNILAEGFEAELPIVEPNKVQITGGKETLEKISYVKASIDARGLITDTIKRDTKVTVLDRELNKLDVFVEPEYVTVTVPVNNPRKTVPLKIKQVGSSPEGTVIKRMEGDIEEVMIFGRTDILQKVDEIEAEVDVSKITKDEELDVPIIRPDGINKITPEIVKVKVVTDKAKKKSEETSLSEVPIESKGLAEGLDVEFLSPEDGAVSIKVEGSKDQLKKAQESAFEVFMNMEGLQAGDHEVNLEVKGPKDVKWELSTEKAKVRIKEKETV